MGSGFGCEVEGKKKKGTEVLKCLMDIIYKYASYIKKNALEGTDMVRLCGKPLNSTRGNQQVYRMILRNKCCVHPQATMFVYWLKKDNNINISKLKLLHHRHSCYFSICESLYYKVSKKITKI